MAVKKARGKEKAVRKTPAKKVQFQFPAAQAAEAYLVGEFNNWDTSAHPMKKDKNGVWELTIALQPGRYEYRFFIDGDWQSDISCCGCVPNEFGSMNCVRIVE
jgi:1,4-alpha-glucan branching enzyme